MSDYFRSGCGCILCIDVDDRVQDRPTKIGYIETWGQCPNCDKMCSTEYSYFLHLRSHLNVYTYLCEFCLRMYRKKKHLKDHLNNHDRFKGTYRCAHCNQLFPNMTEHTLHQNVHLNHFYRGKDGTYCYHCNASFRTMADSVIHEANHHFHCLICRFSSKTQSQYRRHCVEQHRLGQTAEEWRREREARLKHVAKHTKGESIELQDKKYKCFICCLTFSKKISMVMHLNLHQYYECRYCPKFFGTDQLRLAHHLSCTSNPRNSVSVPEGYKHRQSRTSNPRNRDSGPEGYNVEITKLESIVIKKQIELAVRQLDNLDTALPSTSYTANAKVQMQYLYVSATVSPNKNSEDIQNESMSDEDGDIQKESVSDEDEDIQNESMSDEDEDIQKESMADEDEDIQKESTSDEDEDIQKESTSDEDEDIQKESTSDEDEDIQNEYV